MLSITNSKSLQVCDIIEEDGGKTIAYDPRNKILIFVSPDPNRFGSGLTRPETANQYFKVLNGENYRKSNLITRIGFREPLYDLHDTPQKENVFLKPKTVENMINLLNQPYSPSKAADKRLVQQWLISKNEQIQQFNQINNANLPMLNNLTNWQAALIYTNQITGLEPEPTLKNDRRILGQQINNNYLPFDLAMPDYIAGLPESKAYRRANGFKSLKRY